MDKLTALRVFRRVVELSGFSAAAEDLGLSNAAVSKNVQELEAELGARLLNRTTRRVNPTEAGQLYYDRISAMLDELGDADAFVSDYSTSPRGTLKINAPMSMGLTRVAPVVSDFLVAYPEISVDLQMNDAVVDLIQNGFDIGIRGAGGLKDSSLVARKLGNISRSLCAAPAYIESAPALKQPEDLGAHECLIYSLSSSPDVWTFKKAERTAEISVSGRLKINNSIALKDAAIAGAGLALLPDFVCDEALADGRLKALLPDWRAATQAIYAVYPAHREHSQKLRVFLDFLADRLQPG